MGCHTARPRLTSGTVRANAPSADREGNSSTESSKGWVEPSGLPRTSPWRCWQGPELASFVSNVDVVRSFGRDLQLQLDVARELAAEAADAGTSPSAVDSIVGPLLRRDASWREYYDDRVRARLRSESPSPDEGAVRIAEQEREALAKASAGDALGASAVLTAAIAGASLPARRADLLEAKARYLHPHDPGEALRVQATAYRESRSVARPPAGAVIRPPTDHDAATRLLALLRLHTTGNGLVAEFDALRGELSFDRPASRFEGGCGAIWRLPRCRLSTSGGRGRAGAPTTSCFGAT
jgi:hypothetical protein